MTTMTLCHMTVFQTLANMFKGFKQLWQQQDNNQDPIEVTDISKCQPNDKEHTSVVKYRINRMFPAEMYPDLNRALLSEAEYTPLGGIRTLTEASLLCSIGNLPLQLDCPAEAILGTHCSRVSYTMWILYDINDVGRVVKPLPTRGRFNCGPDILDYTYPKTDMPGDIHRAVKITIGSRLHDSQLRGISVLHYVK